MKKQALMISLALASVLGALAEEKDLHSRFEWVREVDGSFAAGERGRVVVPSDVFGQARNFPDDLRILAADGTQWPYFLHVHKVGLETETLEPEVLNRSFVSGREPYLQFDLVIPQRGGKKAVHNRLDLVTGGHDFVRRVEVFSEGGEGLMAVGHLIDFSGQRGARNRTVRYPDSDADRLYIRIYPNAQNAGEIVDLLSAKLRFRTVEEVDREGVDTVELVDRGREKEPAAQTYEFDLEHENRPVEWVVFDVENASFARSVTVSGRNKEHEPWRWVGGGEIHVLADDRQLEIKLRARHRFLKVHIFHYDDQPLAIRSIRLEAVPRWLVFEAASAGSAGVYFRAWDLKRPSYDLKNRIETKAIATLPLFHTLEATPNPATKTQPWRKYSKWLGLLAVGGVSLLVIGVISSMLKQQKQE